MEESSSQGLNLRTDVWPQPRKASARPCTSRPEPGVVLPNLYIRRRHYLHGSLKVTHGRQSSTFCPAQRTLALICAHFTFCLKHVLQRGAWLLSLVREDAPGQLSPGTTTHVPKLWSLFAATTEAHAHDSPCSAVREASTLRGP